MELQNQNSPRNQSTPLIPPALEFLKTLDRLIIFHDVEAYGSSVMGLGDEGTCTGTTGNIFDISDGETKDHLYVGTEHTDVCFGKACCRNSRSFEIRVKNFSGGLVLNYVRPNPCSNIVKVYLGDEQEFLGRIKQKNHLFTPKYNVEDANGNVKMKIIGPMFGKIGCCCCLLACNVDFNIFRHGGDTDTKASIGRISKEWGGCYREACSTTDKFAVLFPRTMHPTEKALLIGATILINYMYFQVQGAGLIWSREGPA